jgi:hypothetical protein
MYFKCMISRIAYIRSEGFPHIFACVCMSKCFLVEKGSVPFALPFAVHGNLRLYSSIEGRRSLWNFVTINYHLYLYCL